MTVNKPNIGIVISCRLKSTRLPNKAIIKIGGIHSIERCINQVKYSKFRNIVLATSASEENFILKQIAKKKKILFFRGSNKNLILRNLQVANKMNFDHIIRVTGDSPLVSFELINEMTNYHLKKKSNFTYNENLPLGTRCEVVDIKSLKEVYKKTNTRKHGEYLSLFFKNNPKYFKIEEFNLKFSKKFKKIRLNLDYESDLKFIKKLIMYYKNKKIIKLDEIFSFLEIYHNENVFIKSKYNKNKLFKEILKDSKIIR